MGDKKKMDVLAMLTPFILNEAIKFFFTLTLRSSPFVI